MLILNALIAFI